MNHRDHPRRPRRRQQLRAGVRPFCPHQPETSTTFSHLLFPAVTSSPQWSSSGPFEFFVRPARAHISGFPRIFRAYSFRTRAVSPPAASVGRSFPLQYGMSFGFVVNQRSCPRELPISYCNLPRRIAIVRAAVRGL